LEGFVDGLTNGNVTEVKVILGSVALALAVYQLVLISVAYAKVRPTFLAPGSASFAHRAVGGTIATLLVATAFMCVSYFGFEENGAHIAAAIGLLVALALKVAIIRRWHGLAHLLPALGTLVFALLAITWLTSAGDFLSESQ
jgi:hypothetical protein